MCTTLDDNEFRRRAVGEQLDLLLGVGNSVHDIIGSLGIKRHIQCQPLSLVYLEVLALTSGPKRVFQALT